MGKGWTHILCGLGRCLGRVSRRGTNLQDCLGMEERVSFPAFGNLGQTCDLHDRQSKAGEARESVGGQRPRPPTSCSRIWPHYRDEHSVPDPVVMESSYLDPLQSSPHCIISESVVL